MMTYREQYLYTSIVAKKILWEGPQQTRIV